MAKTIKVAVIGIAEVDRKLKKLEQRVANKITRKALRESAKLVQTRAKELVPVDTGDLRKSIKVRAIKRSRKHSRLGVLVTTGSGLFKGDTFYGAFIELGTKNIEARPFLRTAAKETRKDARARFLEVLKEELRKAVSQVKSGV